MKIYSSSHLTPAESIERTETNEQLGSMNVSNETLKAYAESVLTHYRAVIERHFANLAPYLALYARHPYKITVVRIGPNGTIIGYKPATEPSVSVVRLEDFDPPIKYANLFDVQDRLDANLLTFDFSFRTYDAKEAEVHGTRMALSDALYFLWMGIDAPTFEKLCLELLEAEGLTGEIKIAEIDAKEFDTLREVTLQEPGGFRRVEIWAFKFKHHQDNRISANDLRELEARFEYHGPSAETFCLITSGDLTTIGRSIAVRNPRVRVWDRDVLNRLVNKHLIILEKYFAPYPKAIDALMLQFDPANAKRYDEFKQRLAACPSGREHFNEYEEIGTELWQYIFADKLGTPKVQRTTTDRVQRRDSLFPNLRKSGFFDRVFIRFDADFIIVDFKNYGDEINSDVIEEVSHYANRALGNLVIAVTRKGGGSAANTGQVRVLKDRNIAVLAVSDEHMLEMIARKERGEEPEDVLADLLDELLIKC
jgi:hypothetical protein